MLHPASRIAGLYVLTSELPGQSETLLERVEEVLQGGARTIQYRDKTSSPQQRRQEASAIAKLCRQHEALFLINDDPELAVAVNADGVHLGQDDMSLAQARAILGTQAIIGISCYDSLALAQQAAAAGADYIAFGSVYPSATKPAAVRAPLSLFSAAKQQVQLPLVAIGGISAANAGAVIAAGADAVAVISNVFLADSPYAAAREIADLFLPDR